MRLQEYSDFFIHSFFLKNNVSEDRGNLGISVGEQSVIHFMQRQRKVSAEANGNPISDLTMPNRTYLHSYKDSER